LLRQNRIAEHTSQSTAQDSSTHHRAQLAHTPQSATGSQGAKRARRADITRQPTQQSRHDTQQCNARSRADKTEFVPLRNTKQHTPRTAHPQRVATRRSNTECAQGTCTHNKTRASKYTTKLTAHGSPKAKLRPNRVARRARDHRREPREQEPGPEKLKKAL